mmetsp:Transcript_48720/g.122980  ORF Transcript_48720/g.122980 Transcript_48720/m.122980 type:complete len:571 (-) Transcript_48720:34-1746(-)
MWACCAVEREAVKPENGERTREAPRRHEKIADRKISNGGNGRNIGLGLIANESEKPMPPAEGTGAEVPHANSPRSTANQWEKGDKTGGDPVSNASTSASSSPMSSGNLLPGGVASQQQPGQSNANANKARTNFQSRDSAASRMLRSRSSRLLMDQAEPEDEDGESGAEEEQQTQTRSPLQRRKSMKNVAEYNKSSDKLDLEDDGASTPKPRGYMAAVTSSVRSRFFKSSPRGNQKAVKDAPDHGSSASSAATAGRSPSKEKNQGLTRRNSQFTYAESAQTAIVFDWDDTLFPTSYLIDDLRLNHKKAMKDQRLPRDLHEEVTLSLKELEQCVIGLLNLAHGRGKVILVTLARPPWVEDSCKSFFPLVGALIQQLGIKVVYAQQGVTVDYDKRKMMCDDEIERFYAEMKGKAISREVEAFYSQYEGQSWKNIISIGDSDFERLGTMMMTQEYMRRRGLIKDAKNGDTFEVTVASNEAFGRNTGSVDVNGHVYKVRTKTFKMLDSPTIGELKEETQLIYRWLPKMIELDDGFDADLSALDDARLIENIEQVLTGPKKNGMAKGAKPKAKGGP